MNIIIPNTITGNIVDLNPRDNPYIMFVATPVSQDYASSYTGLWEYEVIYLLI